MEEKANAPFWKPALIYGAIVGFVGILISLVFYFLNMSTDSWTGYLTMAVGIAILVYCLVAYRNEYLGGFASFKQIFLMALVIGIISSIISALYAYVLYTVIDPGLLDKLRIAAEEKIMNNPRIPESMYDGLFEKMEERMNATRMVTMALIWGPIVNAIIGLIIAAFVKKEENSASNAV
ncbi:MAG: DUF4199 domain-containing protein [Bacteroidota bacterium]